MHIYIYIFEKNYFQFLVKKISYFAEKLSFRQKQKVLVQIKPQKSIPSFIKHAYIWKNLFFCNFN